MLPDRKHKPTKMPSAESRSLAKHSLTEGLCSCLYFTPICTCNSSCAGPPARIQFCIPIQRFRLCFPQRKLKREGEGRKKDVKIGKEVIMISIRTEIYFCQEEALDVPSFKPNSALTLTFRYSFTLFLLLHPFSPSQPV